MPFKLAGAVIACEGEAPVAAIDRDAITDVGHERALFDTVAGLEGIAVQGDVVQRPARVERDKEMTVPAGCTIGVNRRCILSGRAQRCGAEVVRQAEAKTPFTPDVSILISS